MGDRGPVKDDINRELMESFNISFGSVLAEMGKKRSLYEFIEIFQHHHQQQQQNPTTNNKDLRQPSFQHISHYLWPMEIHDKGILTACPQLFKVAAPKKEE
eukprot:jgi/Bigna1/72914/fgenesh1_pg.22_\